MEAYQGLRQVRLVEGLRRPPPGITKSQRLLRHLTTLKLSQTMLLA